MIFFAYVAAVTVAYLAVAVVNPALAVALTLVVVAAICIPGCAVEHREWKRRHGRH